MKNQSYKQYAIRTAKKSRLLVNCLIAFLVGGAICTLGQALLCFFKSLGLSDEQSKKIVTISLIFLACFFTAIGWFDNLAKFAGAGTAVPITGFANSMCSQTIDSKAEGWILGVGANMFKIAGPVIAYGTIASVVYGFIYWITTLF